MVLEGRRCILWNVYFRVAGPAILSSAHSGLLAFAGERLPDDHADRLRDVALFRATHHDLPLSTGGEDQVSSGDKTFPQSQSRRSARLISGGESGETMGLVMRRYSAQQKRNTLSI